jgi:plasmid stabilization system protein ParE
VASVHFTRRALVHLSEIRASSIEKHGERVAAAYLQKIEDALNMLSEYPNLLQDRPYANFLRFYPVAQHMLVCTVIEPDIYILAVHYGGSDIEGLMLRLEGTLLREASILHQKIGDNAKR